MVRDLNAEWVRAGNVDCHVHRNAAIMPRDLSETLQAIPAGSEADRPFQSVGRYIGACKDRIIDGRGTWSWPTYSKFRGPTYEGEWRNGLEQGRGVLHQYPRIEGQWQRGTLLEKGVTITWSVNQYYEGGAKAIEQGMLWEAGTFLHSLWDKSGFVADGQGTLRVRPTRYGADFENTYEGQWVNGRIQHGIGTEYWGRYEGPFDDNLRYHGQGIMRYSAESPWYSLYMGSWRNGYFYGQGTLTFVGNQVATGEWRGVTRRVTGSASWGGALWNGTMTNTDGFELTLQNGVCPYEPWAVFVYPKWAYNTYGFEISEASTIIGNMVWSWCESVLDCYNCSRRPRGADSPILE